MVGEVKTARANTDNAIKAMYELLAAMKVMMPSAELDNLISQLDAIEAYAWQYYLNGKGGSNGTGTGTTTPTTPENPGTGDNQGGGTTPTTPDTPSDPGTGGGNTGGGGDEPFDDGD